MDSQSNLDYLLKQILRELERKNGANCKQEIDNSLEIQKKKQTLSPSQLLVISGLLINVFSVESLLIDKDQTIQIVLEGSLKQKTKLDKMLDEMGDMSFDTVVQALFNRYE